MKAVEIISVPVTDQQRSKEFYLKMGPVPRPCNPFADGGKHKPITLYSEIIFSKNLAGRHY